MGQSSSTQRDQRQDSASRFSFPSRRHSNGQETIINSADMSGQSDDHAPPPPAGQEADRNSIYNILTHPPNPSDSTNFQSLSFEPSDVRASTPTASSEQEPSTFMDVRNQDSRAASISRMMARRQSTMSRLGSRILPNSVIRGLLNSEEETPAEGHAHRSGRLSRSFPRSEAGRFSPFTSLGSRGISRRRSIRGPYPLPRGDAALIPDSPPNPTYVDSATEPMSDSTRGSWRRSARLSRVRHSIATPISHMFRPPSPPTSSQGTRNAPQRPSRSSFPEGAEQLLPPLAPMDTNMEFDDAPHELDSVEPAIRNSQPLSPIPSRPSSGSMRRFPGILRARPSRIMRREEQTPLSRVLQLAAAAIAAQLSGSTSPALSNVQSLGNDGLDASLENFIQSLQQATSAQANTPTPGDPNDQTAEGNPAPVNFLRVFRFANPDTAPGSLEDSTAQSREQIDHTDRMDIDESAEEGAEGRTVTLVVVGVRFSPHRNLPGGTNTFPTNYDRQRHQRVPSSASRRLSDASSSPNGVTSTIPAVLSESPPGPNPPPSTPAEPILSTVSSENTIPSRRPSSASALFPSTLPQLHEEPSTQITVEPSDGDILSSGARQRRRSDSEYARHRHLGSGAARRNGVVEPDHPTPAPGRTWLIYVVGTNLSEHHPAFATPSLFTDNPTYEDMILLSSLLGPAKPPVASQADVTSAGGLFQLVEYAGALVAEAIDGSQESIPIGENERCLICLSDYEAADEVRLLTKCKHVYHKECIDQWLTTGRNSCPLCRGQGVVESTNPTSNAPTQEAAA